MTSTMTSRLLPITAAVALLCATLISGAPTSASASSGLTITANAADFALRQYAAYSGARVSSPAQTIHLSFPAELAALDVTTLDISVSHSPDGSSTLLKSVPNDGVAVDFSAASLGLAAGQTSFTVTVSGRPTAGEKDAVDLQYYGYSLPTVPGQTPDPIVNFDLALNNAYFSSAGYSFLSNDRPVVHPGEIITVVSDQPIFRSGPTGTLTSPKDPTGEVRSDVGIFGADLDLVVASDAKSLTFTVPRRGGDWADDDNAARLRQEFADRANTWIALPLEYADVTPDVGRIGGETRYDVAVALSQSAFPDSATPLHVPVVYIAKGTDYPDALSAAPAAANDGGPLLLTLPDQLPSAVATELRRLNPDKIIVVGGPASVSEHVFVQLAQFVPRSAQVTRIGGADRYEVSRRLVDLAFGDEPGDRVYLATGRNFPDALSASAAAGASGDAVLLIDGSAQNLDDASKTALTGLHPDEVVVGGGPNSVSEGILTSVQSMNWPGGAYRISGADRFEASRNINLDGFHDATDVFIATGLKFPDALAGAAIAGSIGAPLYVVPSDCIPPAVLQDIHSYRAETITLLGGSGSLTPDVENLARCRA